MVKKSLAPVIAAVLLAVGLLYLFNESEEGKIKKQFDFISDSVKKEAGENPIIGAAKIKQITDILTDPCIVEIPFRSESRTMSSQEISSYIYARRTHLETLSLDFHDIAVDIPDETSAKASSLAVFKGEIKSGEQYEEMYEFDFSLTKTDDTWRINRVEVIEVVER